MPDVSVFRNFDTVSEEIELSKVLELIQKGSFKVEVSKIRNLLIDGKKDLADSLKLKLPSFTPSGLFNMVRNKNTLKKYSGFIVLDIDKLSPDDLIKIKSEILTIPFTYACFISPGNRGLKVLVKVDSSYFYHKQAYSELRLYYEDIIKYDIDKSGSDIARLCFFSYDPGLYINNDCETFKTSINMVEENIKKVVDQIEEKHIDITSDYKDWLSIGFALVDGLGDGARDYFHRVSRFYSGYNYSECDNQFNKCLKSNGKGITLSSFFHYAKNNGIDISVPESLLVSKDEKEQKISKSEKILLIAAIKNYLKTRYTFRYNIVSNKIEYKKSGKEHWLPMNDYMENSIFCDLQEHNIKCSQTFLRSILFSDFCPHYDPFKQYLNELPVWDKSTDHISELAKTIKTTNDPFWQKCFKKWLIASVASLMDDLVVNQTVLIFTGPQGIGKTTWMENLCPDKLKQYLFSGTINPNNKDTLIHMAECIFINMDELENMNRTEIGTFKEIITKNSIRMRRPYGHSQENFSRRASFMGSVNSVQFLIDPTGSRRFLCFEVEKIDYHHSIDLNLVYSQAVTLYNEGFKYYFDGAEINEIIQNNDQFQVRSVEEELLLTYYKIPESESYITKYLKATEILVRLSERSKISVNNGTAINMGKCLKKNGFQRSKKNGLYVWAVEEVDPESIS